MSSQQTHTHTRIVSYAQKICRIFLEAVSNGRLWQCAEILLSAISFHFISMSSKREGKKFGNDDLHFSHQTNINRSSYVPLPSSVRHIKKMLHKQKGIHHKKIFSWICNCKIWTCLPKILQNIFKRWKFHIFCGTRWI